MKHMLWAILTVLPLSSFGGTTIEHGYTMQKRELSRLLYAIFDAELRGAPKKEDPPAKEPFSDGKIITEELTLDQKLPPDFPVTGDPNGK